MSKYAKKFAAIGFLLFLALWAAGVARSFTLAQPEPQPVSAAITSAIDDTLSPARLRCMNNLRQLALLAPLPLAQVLDQGDVNQIRVCDKTARIASGTTLFADDQDRIQKAIATHKAVTLSEQNTGLAPERRLSLEISVAPDRFNAIVDELSQAGQLASIKVEQQDRTGEFRRLHAQRQALKKHQEAMLKLRDINKLSVAEALSLEQKILESDKEIQSLGVQLGDFLDKEPGYNIVATLEEHQPGSRQDRSFTFARRLESGLLWALGWWAVAALAIGLLVATYVSGKALWPGSMIMRRLVAGS